MTNDPTLWGTFDQYEKLPVVVGYLGNFEYLYRYSTTATTINLIDQLCTSVRKIAKRYRISMNRFGSEHLFVGLCYPNRIPLRKVIKFGFEAQHKIFDIQAQAGTLNKTPAFLSIGIHVASALVGTFGFERTGVFGDSFEGALSLATTAKDDTLKITTEVLGELHLNERAHYQLDPVVVQERIAGFRLTKRIE
jgi:hypothetical protein